MMNPIVEEEPIASSSPEEETKKEETQSPPVQEPQNRYQSGTQFSSTPLPMMSYAPAAFPSQMDGSGATVFNGSIPTYQQGVSCYFYSEELFIDHNQWTLPHPLFYNFLFFFLKKESNKQNREINFYFLFLIFRFQFFFFL